MLLKVRSGERWGPPNFVLLVTLRHTCACRVHQMINVDTNLRTAVSIRTTSCIRNMEVPLVSSLLTLKNSTPFRSISCRIWGSVAGCVYQQRSKYWQVKIKKHASTGTNYVILTKRVKEQHEKKTVSNLKSMHSVVFEQTSTKFLRF